MNTSPNKQLYSIHKGVSAGGTASDGRSTGSSSDIWNWNPKMQIKIIKIYKNI